MIPERDMLAIQMFLAELKDEELFKKRLDHLEALKTEINEQIEVHGKAKDITRLNHQASMNNTEAKKLFEEAKGKRDKADAEANAIIETARTRAKEMDADADSRLREREQKLADGEKDLVQRNNEYNKSLADLAAREKQVAEDMKSAVAIRTHYTEAVQSLKTAIETTAKAL
jgi:F0F1-type ATP synthase membrane subunit b/b'